MEGVLRLLCFCSGFGLIFGKVGFVKDLNMDAEFPPQVIQSNRRIPEGHLRPLGYQVSPDHPVEDYEGMVESPDLYNNYLKSKTPVVFRDSFPDTDIFSNWEEDEYLRERYGQINVSVVTRKGMKNDYLLRERKTMKFKKFLLEYLYEDWYMAGTVPHDFMHELPLPKCVQCGTVANYLQEAELWMSSGGTSSMLHSHADHNLHCVLFGRRDFILIEHQYRNNFAFKHESPGSLGGHSPLDMEFINVMKYKKIGETPWAWSTLHQGDCILIPAGYLHQIRSHGRSISVTILITPTPTFEPTGCSKKNYRKSRTLSDASFIWSFADGKRVLTNWQLNAESLRYLLLAELRDGSTLTIEQFRIFYNQAMVVEESPEVTGTDVFAILFEPGTREVTRDDIKNLNSSNLERAAKIFNKPYIKNPRTPLDHSHDHSDDAERVEL